MRRPWMKALHVIALSAALLAVGGCQHQTQTAPKGAASSANAGVAGKPVNSRCPVMDDEVNPKITTNYKGQTVGFCCSECIEDWNSWSEEKKTVKLNAAK
jgi:hypothetical protein